MYRMLACLFLACTMARGADVPPQTTFPLWDGKESIEQYAKRVNLPTTKTLDLGNNVKLELLLIPVGYVMAELNEMMKAGKVPGYKDIHGVYADGIHLNNVGSYITACTFYATIFKEEPSGLPSSSYQINDAALVKIIHETVWKVVSAHPYSGVQ